MKKIMLTLSVMLIVFSMIVYITEDISWIRDNLRFVTGFSRYVAFAFVSGIFLLVLSAYNFAWAFIVSFIVGIIILLRGLIV